MKKPDITEKDPVKKRVDGIIASIHQASKELANKNSSTEILIVNERMFSAMVNEGSLGDFDKKVLKETRKIIRTLKIKGFKLSETQHTENHSFTSADCCDSSYGPCVYYYIKVEKIL